MKYEPERKLGKKEIKVLWERGYNQDRKIKFYDSNSENREDNEENNRIYALEFSVSGLQHRKAKH